jgi:hypothetical protein
MTWNELQPVVTEQAKYAVLRYDERRQDKVQELVCQSFEKFRSDVAAGKEIKKQAFKCFVTQRANEVDIRSVCKDGYGGTSQLDPLGFFLRRQNSPIEVTSFNEWMPSDARTREAADSALTFSVDYGIWMSKLNDVQRTILEFLIQGYNVKEIASMFKATRCRITATIKGIQQQFLNYFGKAAC